MQLDLNTAKYTQVNCHYSEMRLFVYVNREHFKTLQKNRGISPLLHLTLHPYVHSVCHHTTNLLYVLDMRHADTHHCTDRLQASATREYEQRRLFRRGASVSYAVRSPHACEEMCLGFNALRKTERTNVKKLTHFGQMGSYRYFSSPPPMMSNSSTYPLAAWKKGKLLMSG